MVRLCGIFAKDDSMKDKKKEMYRYCKKATKHLVKGKCEMEILQAKSD